MESGKRAREPGQPSAYRLPMRINPGLAKKNKPKIRRAQPWVKCSKCGQPLAPPYVAPGDHREAFAAAVKDAAVGAKPLQGPLLLSVVSEWPSKRKKGPAEGRPMGDADACLSATMDVCAEAGLFGNDGQVAVVVGVSAYGGKPGRLSIAARELEQGDLEVLGELIGEQLTELQVMVGCRGIKPVEQPAPHKRGAAR